VRLCYEYSNTKLKDLTKYECEIKTIVENFKNKNCAGNDYLGWYDYPNEISETFINNIYECANVIKENSEVLVVCGIGGSYLGARAVIEAIKGFKYKDLEIIYMGNTFDEKYTEDMLKYLLSKDFSVNVISKSGTTLETAFAFRLLKEMLENKYGEHAKQRIFVTTDEIDGCLRKICCQEGYKSFSIPKDIGGRYSVFTPVGLLPMAVMGVDIRELCNGVKKAKEEMDINDFANNIAYQYAAYRFHQYSGGKKIELFSSYSPYLVMVAEWWKQLFGESEGKNGKGLFPASVNFSTDLHSLGQFVQQGSKILYVTQLKVLGEGKLKLNYDEENFDDLNYLTETPLKEINLKAQEGTNKAHYGIGRVDNLTLELKNIDEFNLGYLLYFFMYSCMISAYLIGVNPFDQPGVEFYKKEMKKLLKK